MRFFYQGAHQHSCIEKTTARTAFRQGEQLLALQQSGLLPRTSLMPTDVANSVFEHERRAIAYSPYGHDGLKNPIHFGFKGEYRDTLTGNYLLGNGYRLDRVPGSGVTEPAEGALRAKEDGHRG
ncbi:hypothetical protein AB3H04_17235, partial [Pseudomonas putida]